MKRTYNWLFKVVRGGVPRDRRVLEPELARELQASYNNAAKMNSPMPRTLQVRLVVNNEECLIEIYPKKPDDLPAIGNSDLYFCVKHFEDDMDDESRAGGTEEKAAEHIVQELTFEPSAPSATKKDLFDFLIHPAKEKILNALAEGFAGYSARRTWAQKHYCSIPKILELPQPAIPAFIFAGPPGTGKTAMASCIGVAIAAKLSRPVTFLRVGMSLRGTGLQGKTSEIVHGLFRNVKKLFTGKMVLLFFDEADAFVPSRQQMDHSSGSHENLAIVNAIIKEMDDIRSQPGCQIVVLFATNALPRLDAAVVRRCKVFHFTTPTPKEHKTVLEAALAGFGFQDEEIAGLHGDLLAREQSVPNWAFSFSDIIEGVILPAIDEARLENRPLSSQILQKCIREAKPMVRRDVIPSYIK